MASRVNRKLRRRRRARIALRISLIVVVIAAIAAALIIVLRKTGITSSNKRYLASTSAFAEVYIYDEYEKRLFKTTTSIQRGTEVTTTNETYTENGRTYVVCKCGDETFYVNEDSLVSDLDDIVQETEKWVRTSATVYANYEGADIVSFVKKGSHVTLTGYDELLEDGSANMYEIEYDDEGHTGWVFSKYLVDSQKDADAVNEDIYTIHQDRAYGSELYGGSATSLDWYPYEKPEFEDNVLLEDARVMYINSSAIENIDEYIELATANGVNAFCIDMKDKTVACPFDTVKEYSPTTAENYGYSVDYVAQAIEKVKKAGLYVIARIVVFNDEYYAADHPEDCIQSAAATQDWPSAFCRDVWTYNVKLAEEVIEKFAPNEIQFDYVRFPEESYNMSSDDSTDFKNLYDEDKCEAIQNFCFYACDQIHQYNTYVSVDCFAECAGKYVTAYGQYFPAISNVVDAISAMPYTDHFGTTVDTWTDPYETVNDWAQRAAARQAEIETPALVRTWLTCYSVPWWNPTTTISDDYFTMEAQALYDAGLTGGFLGWNGSSKLAHYTAAAPAWGKDYGYGTGSVPGVKSTPTETGNRAYTPADTD